MEAMLHLRAGVTGGFRGSAAANGPGSASLAVPSSSVCEGLLPHKGLCGRGGCEDVATQRTVQRRRQRKKNPQSDSAAGAADTAGAPLGLCLATA